MTTGERDVLVYLGGVPWEGPKGTDRHLAERLGLLGPVLWIDPPVSVTEVARGHRDLRRLADVDEVAPGVRRVRILAPPYPTRPGVVRLTELVEARILRSVMRRLRVRPAGVVNATPYISFDVVPRPRGGVRLYYATDDFVAGAALLGHSEAALHAAEARRLAEADVLAAVSDQIMRGWPAAGLPSVVLPNGCDVAAYDGVQEAPLPTDVVVNGPVAGVVGQFSSRLDLGLLEAVAATRLSLLLVGPVRADLDRSRWDALVDRPNVTWVGAKPFDTLPSYLRLIDVGLTPYANSDFNRASFPLKTLEYLAAGRPVVSTALPAVEELGTSHVVTADTPAGFADAALRLAERSSSPEQAASRRDFAARHDWSIRAAQLRSIVLAGQSAAVPV